MSIADLQDRAEALGRPGGIANFAEAAPGVERSEAPTVSHGEGSLYAARTKIYPKRAYGTFRTIKWIVMAVTLSIYYAVPWIRWDRGPYLPDQAVLIDFSSRRFFFFFLEIWPQEFYYITGLLVLAALGLFLVTSIAGRMWCGYTCPQTVWTDLMIAVERFFQGDRNQRMRLDKAPWSFETLWRKSATHLAWLLIAVATGGAWVFYFADAPTLARQLVTFDAPMLAYVFVGIFTATTYVLGGIAREQVCIYMCPWPRIQGGMIDRDSLLVSYRAWRGEPRGAHKAGQSWEGRGDCIDCRQCVAVCPTGIDIRHGSQLECIQCALCIDACNEIMDKVGRPRGLVAYDTVRNLEHTGSGDPSSILDQASRRALRHGDGDCRRHHADGADASARTGGECAARPQSALRQAFRRWIAQRLHRENSQQGLSATRVQTRREPAQRSDREHRRSGQAGRSRHHRTGR